MLTSNLVAQKQTPCHHQLLISGRSLDSQQLFLYCADVCMLTVLPVRGSSVMHAPHTVWRQPVLEALKQSSGLISVGTSSDQLQVSVSWASGERSPCFWNAGSLPDCKDALHRRHNSEAKSAAAFFTSHVGAGSRLQCFPGSLSVFDLLDFYRLEAAKCDKYGRQA